MSRAKPETFFTQSSGLMNCDAEGGTVHPEPVFLSMMRLG
jgi:hypothetical protein